MVFQSFDLKSRPSLKKLLYVMKFTAIILLSACLTATAKGFSQITLSEKNAPLQKVFKEMQKQSGYEFFYAYELIQQAGKVTIKVNNAPLEKAIEECLKGKPLTYVVIGKTVVINAKVTGKMEPGKFTESVMLPPIEVQGTVKDSTGNPLSGATVSVKGTNVRALTDTNGNFSLTVPDKGGILEISYVGYSTVDIHVSKSQVLHIVMQFQFARVEDIVVVGYGTQKKINLTGAVSSVSSKELESRPLTNLGSGLEGLIPNLNVNLNNGQPGTGATYNIRGFETIGQNSNAAPLILVDGVQRDANLIDPNDVASVTVLKDAASSAIYGSRAANGVILISTKNPKVGRTHITYNGSYTIARPVN
jgi:TonB-dependent SusC/RagA subfamily outer membrane receptor